MSNPLLKFLCYIFHSTLHPRLNPKSYYLLTLQINIFSHLFSNAPDSEKGKWRQERNVRKRNIAENDYEIARMAVFKVLGNPLDLISFPCDEDMGEFLTFCSKTITKFENHFKRAFFFIFLYLGYI